MRRLRAVWRRSTTATNQRRRTPRAWRRGPNHQFAPNLGRRLTSGGGATASAERWRRNGPDLQAYGSRPGLGWQRSDPNLTPLRPEGDALEGRLRPPCPRHRIEAPAFFTATGTLRLRSGCLFSACALSPSTSLGTSSVEARVPLVVAGTLRCHPEQREGLRSGCLPYKAARSNLRTPAQRRRRGRRRRSQPRPDPCAGRLSPRPDRPGS